MLKLDSGDNNLMVNGNSVVTTRIIIIFILVLKGIYLFITVAGPSVS